MGGCYIVELCFYTFRSRFQPRIQGCLSAGKIHPNMLGFMASWSFKMMKKNARCTHDMQLGFRSIFFHFALLFDAFPVCLESQEIDLQKPSRNFVNCCAYFLVHTKRCPSYSSLFFQKFSLNTQPKCMILVLFGSKYECIKAFKKMNHDFMQF